MMRWAIAVCLMALSVQAAPAVQPDEVLSDPALETRAREISAELRCMVCQNQSIDDSNAELARDLRVVVRERLLAGDTDAEVMDFVVARYGEFVLLKPRFNLRNALLWGAPVLLLGCGAVLIALKVRARPRQGGAPLSEAENAALKDILREHDQRS